MTDSPLVGSSSYEETERANEYNACGVDTDYSKVEGNDSSHQGGILPADNFPLWASLSRRFATKTGFFTPERGSKGAEVRAVPAGKLLESNTWLR